MNNSDFTIVTFKLTNEFEVACFCRYVEEADAVKFALGAINNLRQAIQSVHPCINYIDTKTHYNIETWDNLRFRCYRYPDEYLVYDGACKCYSVHGKGAKTALMDYAEGYLDPKCIGSYAFSRVTVIFNKAKADWFMQFQAHSLSSFGYKPENDHTKNEEYVDEAITDAMLNKLDRLNNSRAKLWITVEKLRKSRKAHLEINGVIREFEIIQAICHELQNDFDGTSMQEEMAGVAHDVYKLRQAVTELREKAIRLKENSENKKFMEEDGNFGQKLKNLFNWK